MNDLNHLIMQGAWRGLRKTLAQDGATIRDWMRKLLT